MDQKISLEEFNTRLDIHNRALLEQIRYLESRNIQMQTLIQEREALAEQWEQTLQMVRRERLRIENELRTLTLASAA